MKKILILLSSLFCLIYITSAININLSSGNKLDNSNWQNISSITNKINLSSDNLNIAGKLVSNSKICSGNSCIGECGEGLTWDIASNSCIDDWVKIGPHGGFPDGTILSTTGRRSVSCGDSEVLSACESSCRSIPEVTAWSCRDDDNGYPEYRGMCNCYSGNTIELTDMGVSFNGGQIMRSAYSISRRIQ